MKRKLGRNSHSVPAPVHLIASPPATTCPSLEYLIEWNQIHRFFLKRPAKLAGDEMTLTTPPGIGMELDKTKVESEETKVLVST